MRIWDNYNKQWLEPMVIYFGADQEVWKIDAVKKGEYPLEDGWYSLQGEDLEHIAIDGEIELNKHLIPKDESEDKGCRP